MASNAQFLIDMQLRFRQTGLDQIGAQVRSQLAQLASLPAPERQSAAQQLRVQAETQFSQGRQQILKGLDPTSADFTTATAALGAIKTNMRSAFAKIESGTIDLKAIDFTGLTKAARADLTESITAFNALPKSVREEVGRAIAAANASLDTATLTRITQQQAAGTVTNPSTTSPVAAAAGIDRAAATIDRSAENAVYQRVLSEDTAYAESEAAAARFKALQAQKIQETLAADTVYIEASAAASNAQRSQATRIKAASLGISTQGVGDEQLSVASAIQERIRAERRAAAVTLATAERETVQGQELAVARAARRDADRQLATIEHEEARKEVLAAVQRGDGTLFQRLQSQFAYRGQNRLPEEQQTLGQFVGAKTLTTVGFGVAGAALYGGVRAVTDMEKQSEALEVTLNQIQAQLSSIGKEAEGTFGAAKSGILSIARDTGSQANDVAKVFFQFRGAFSQGNSALRDTNEALHQTDEAMKIVKVTGLSLAEVIDSLTAVAITFKTGVADIGDAALGLQERLGVMAKETITFVADMAPVAKETGASLKDVAALGAVAQQVTGKSGGAVAESFNRALPQIQNVKSQILGLYNLPQLQSGRQTVLAGFATGDTFDVFKQLTRDFNSLSKTQQQTIIDTLGTRRETADLIAVLGQSDKLVAQWDRTSTGIGSDVGKVDDYFSKLKETVANTTARFGQIFSQIGIAIYRSGIATSIADIIDVAGHFIEVIAGLLNIVGGLNNALGGLPVKLLLIAGIMRLLSPLTNAAAVALHLKAAAADEDAVANDVDAAALIRVDQAAKTVTVNLAALSGVVTEEGAAAGIAAAENATNAAAIGAEGGAGAVGGAGAAAAPLLVRNALPRAEAAAIPVVGSAEHLAALDNAFIPVEAGAATAATGAAGFGATLLAAAPILVAFEGISQFFSNSAKGAAAATAEANRAKTVLDAAGKPGSNLSVEDAIKQLRENEVNSSNQNGKYLASNDPLSRGFNFVGGTLTNLFGGQGDAALRAAAGKPQDAEIDEAAIRAKVAEGYTAIIQPVLSKNGEKLVDALKSVNTIDVLNKEIAANPSFSKGLVGIFGGDKKKGGGIADGGIDFTTVIKSGELTKENLQKVVDLASKGDQAAGNVLRLLSDYLKNDPKLASLLADSKTKQAISDAGGAGQYALQNIDDVKNEFDAGQVTLGTYIQRLTQERKNLSDQINTDRDLGQTIDPKDLLALAKANQALSDAIHTKVQQAQATNADLYGQVTGVGTPEQQAQAGGQRVVGNVTVKGDVQGFLLTQKIQTLTAQLAPSTDVSLDTQIGQIPDLIKLLQEKFSRDLQNIQDPTKRAVAAEQGFTLPPILNELFVISQLKTDIPFTAQLQEFANVTNQSLDSLFTQIAQQVISTGQTVQQVTNQIIEQQITKLTGELSGIPDAKAKDINDQIATLRGQEVKVTALPPVPVQQLPGTSPGDQATVDAANAAKQQHDAAIGQAQASLAQARANGDPVAVARANQQAASAAEKAAGDDDVAKLNAQAQYVQASNAAEQARDDIAKARLALYKSQVARDPIRSAQIGVQEAQQAISAAHGEAARLNAQAGLASANEALDNALNDLVTAKADQTIAIAEAAGKTVEAAQDKLNEAQRQLQVVLGDASSGPTEATKAQTAVIQAQAAKRDADYQDQLGTIDFLQTMEQISTQQAIAMLTAMEQIPNLTQAQLRELQTKIKSLSDAAKQNYQFNLPANIDLPTLYQARRLNQTPGGSGYNDNRVVTVNFTANNTADAQSIANTIVDGFGAPSRFGSAPRMY